ncbi:DUF397 domain-containing protein [Sphaerisporangium sp. NPDC088356]|uniref:DUF397 domain-containing protein n=1 Tax=Sphaerisporangium sp. NPDC088356 TaxID=3154871 RepID=UPI0034440FD4
MVVWILYVRKSPRTRRNRVEVAHLRGGRRAVRDSKDRNGPALVFTPVEWTTFLDHLKTDLTA